jgi:membrane-bound lytic murein transglycosylase D
MGGASAQGLKVTTMYPQKITLLFVAFTLAACTHTTQKAVRPQIVTAAPMQKNHPAETPEAPSNKPEKKTEDTQAIFDQALEFCESSQKFWAEDDIENAISALDQAYDLILQTDTHDNPEFARQKEDIRLTIAKRMLEIHSSRHTEVNGKHKAIPKFINADVEAEINLFTGEQKGFVLRSYRRSGKYRDMIIEAFEEAGLPRELIWLPLIESGFKVRALSPARALGLWQFIPSTGYRFGLKRDEWVDERMNPEKATKAAIAYLQELHRIFGDWTTVLAAYNCGGGRVLRVIRSQNINYLDNFWDLYQRLPKETRRYVPRFLAAMIILDEPEKYGIKLPEMDPRQEYETVEVKQPMRLVNVARAMGIDAKALEDLNPDLRHQVTPPYAHSLKVPKGRSRVLLSKLERIPRYKPKKVPRYAFHLIRHGETLSCLAGKYHVSIDSIARTNKIKKSTTLRVGQKLKIPISPKKKARLAASVKPQAYHVRKGDSLWRVAYLHNISTRELMRLNNLQSSIIQTGQKLMVPKPKSKLKIPTDTKVYEVKPGDSPYQIAVDHDMKLERFLKLNRLKIKSQIFPGQVVLVNKK